MFLNIKIWPKIETIAGYITQGMSRPGINGIIDYS